MSVIAGRVWPPVKVHVFILVFQRLGVRFSQVKRDMGQKQRRITADKDAKDVDNVVAG